MGCRSAAKWAEIGRSVVNGRRNGTVATSRGGGVPGKKRRCPNTKERVHHYWCNKSFVYPPPLKTDDALPAQQKHSGHSRRWVSYRYDPLANCDTHHNANETCDRNVTVALDFLKRQGGTAVATSLYLGCGHMINKTGHLVLQDPRNDPWAAGCAIMIPGLNAMGIRPEPMVTAHTVDHVSAVVGLRAMFAAPSVVINQLVDYVRTNKLKGITWDLGNTTDQAQFARFLGKLRAALAPLGARVTVFWGTAAFAGGITANLVQLSANADRVLSCAYGGSPIADWHKDNIAPLLGKGINRSRVAISMKAGGVHAHQNLSGWRRCSCCSTKTRKRRCTCAGPYSRWCQTAIAPASR